MIETKSTEKLLRSALTENNPFYSTSEIIEWLSDRNKNVQVSVSPIQFSELKGWDFQAATGNMMHETGGFFSIEGIQVKTNWGGVPEWTQPIINQPEIGFLGIIAKEFDGVLMFLMQAKIEPGNVNYVQLSPTLQATQSNYRQLHRGKKPKYLEFFLNNKKFKVLLDQLQSEQGGRFLRKRNRNIIIEIYEDLEPHEDFRWLTLGQITKLLKFDNLVNMDTRTVISGISYNTTSIPDVLVPNNLFAVDMLASANEVDEAAHTFDDIISWLTELKVKYVLDVKRIGLKNVEKWVIHDSAIEHIEKKYFKVIPVSVEIGNREVRRWTQPLIQPVQEGICAFIIKKINNVFHFLVQAKLECGNLDILEFAPTVQCLTGNYRSGDVSKVPFLPKILNTSPAQIRLDTYQSEEGGRFFHEQNRNIIIEFDESEHLSLPDNFIWMTLYQLKTFLKFNNYLNVQARSLIAMIDLTE